MARKDILFPVGRLVEGSLVKPQTTNMEGQPLTVKTGVNAGQPRNDFYFAVAIPKGTEIHWDGTPWGAIIHQAGADGFPNQINSPQFAWKVKDGDSAIPNLKGKIPRDKEGFAGHWVVNFSSGYAPKTFDARGQAAVNAESIKLGHYVQVFGNVDSNGSSVKPGVFINHQMVAHSGFGPEIYVGPDPTAVGFGAAGLPAGASTTPVAGIASTANVPQAAGAPPPPPPPARDRQMTPKAAGATREAMNAAGWTDEALIENGYMLLVMPVTAPPPPPPPPIPTAPAPAILAPPPPPPPPPRGPQMTPKAAGATREAMNAAGWTDENLIAHGYMTA